MSDFDIALNKHTACQGSLFCVKLFSCNVPMSLTVRKTYQGVLLIWIRVGQGPTALAVGTGGGCLDIFFISSIISVFFLPLSNDSPMYRLKYFSRAVKPKTTSQQPSQRNSF